jgi:ATP-dependent RNA helicase RhlE
LKFESLGLIRPILDALQEQGYASPTPIQEQAIPAALAGRDVLGCARTGTGKTCAFSAPILQRLSAAPKKRHSIRALILTPTRELAIQIQECIEAYGAHLPVKSVVIFGGVGQNPQIEAIQSGCDILVATPGRLEDLHNQGFIDVSKLEIFVLDEADRMLDMGFIHDVKKILSWLPEKKQTLFFSATMPKEITQLVDSLLHDPVKIAVDPVSSPVEVIDQSVYLVDKGNKTKLLVKLINDRNIPSALVFTRTKHGANRVAQDLTKAGITAAAIHGNKSQTARQAALAGFKDGSVRVLVATDIAARGLDIEALGCVFNYNLPEVPETYVHRIGRTGRAGKDGIAISFCDYGEKPLLRDIEKLIGKSIPVVEDHPFPMQVFEVPVKDARGRVVNPEDAEARAAAKARKAERTKQAKAAKQPAKAEKIEKAEPEQKPAQPKKKKPAKAKPVKVAAPSTAEEPAEAAPSAIKLPNERKYKRPERKPMSALDEIAPALPENERPEPKYGAKRTGRLQNTFFSPEEQKVYGGEPEPLMDATARLFSTRRSVPATRTSALQRRSRRNPARATQRERPRLKNPQSKRQLLSAKSTAATSPASKRAHPLLSSRQSRLPQQSPRQRKKRRATSAAHP